jgi:uroporphyrin-III C-methyltransferase/precorrin-2 dehydrogenase/sirohydrochlorin ferrochelatase
MAALVRLPVFFALAGKRVVVAGGGSAAAWKAELLSAAGAAVDVFAVDPSDEIVEATSQAPQRPIELHRRPVEAADLAGAALAIGSFVNDDEAAQFAALARQMGVPVNVIDKPAHCDFAFGAIINRSPLVVGISTDGAAPAVAQAIRSWFETLLPQGFARWAKAARRWRVHVLTVALSPPEQRRFWQRFTARALAQPNRPPAELDIEMLLSDTREVDGKGMGSVVLVGAGPGDPELLTLRAVRALQSADVILFDKLVAPAILDFARREARKVLVGKTGHGPSCQRDTDLMIKLAREGKQVVCVKGGDAIIFSRIEEVVDACRAADIPIEIVPGISAAQGAAAPKHCR